MYKKSICSIGLVQLTSSDSVDENIAECAKYISKLVADGAQIVFLPENAFYMRREAHHKDDVEFDGKQNPKCSTAEHPGVIAAQKWAKDHSIWVVIGSIAPRENVEQELPYNRCVVIDNEGCITSHYDKIHLFDVELANGECFMESARMAAGEEAKLVHTPWGKIGLSICYDLRFPNLYRGLAQAGASILSIPAAFTVATGEFHWEVLLRARAIETGAFVVASAQCGEHPGGRKSYGHGLIINPWGEVLLDLGEQPGCGVVVVDMTEVEQARSTIPAWNYNKNWKLEAN